VLLIFVLPLGFACLIKSQHCKQKNLRFSPKAFLFGIVGMAGFEPAASTSQMWRDTGLRYIPKGNAKVDF
jgi:hypothetical protein